MVVGAVFCVSDNFCVLYFIELSGAWEVITIGLILLHNRTGKKF